MLVNGASTEYYCAMFTIPQRWQNVKQHLVRVNYPDLLSLSLKPRLILSRIQTFKAEVLISQANLKYVHHWTLNGKSFRLLGSKLGRCCFNFQHSLCAECSSQYETVFLKSTNNTHPVPNACYLEGQNTPSDWASAIPFCQRTSLIWGTGAPLVSFKPLCLFYSSREVIAGIFLLKSFLIYPPNWLTRSEDPTEPSNTFTFKYTTTILALTKASDSHLSSLYSASLFTYKFEHSDVTDTTGIKFYVTEKYRPTEIGIFTVKT